MARPGGLKASKRWAKVERSDNLLLGGPSTGGAPGLLRLFGNLRANPFAAFEFCCGGEAILTEPRVAAFRKPDFRLSGSCPFRGQGDIVVSEFWDYQVLRHRIVMLKVKQLPSSTSTAALKQVCECRVESQQKSKDSVHNCLHPLKRRAKVIRDIIS
jgi:hypothetical protein